jgi:hypothetical protein
MNGKSPIGERSVLGTAKKEAQSEVWAAGGDVRKMHYVLSAASCAPTGPLAKSRRNGHREGVRGVAEERPTRARIALHTHYGQLEPVQDRGSGRTPPSRRSSGAPPSQPPAHRYSLASALEGQDARIEPLVDDKICKI